MPERDYKKRSRGEWESLMERFEAGGLSQRAFCAQEGVAYSSFCYWRRKLRAAEAAEMVPAPLIELPALTTMAAPAWRVELDLGQGLVLRVR